MNHVAASELLGVLVLDACDEAEAAAVRVHVGTCTACETEAVRLSELAGWLGASEAVSPSRGLRSRVLRQTQDDGQA